MRRYEKNETFFQTIDSPEKAYWLGFLGADGCVSPNGFKVALKSGDVSHLRQLSADVSFTGPVRARPSMNASELTVCSMRMRADLIRHGVVPRKSYCNPAPWLPAEHLRAHFWRGYFDGDGSFPIVKSGARTLLRAVFVNSPLVVAAFVADAKRATSASAARIERRNRVELASWANLESVAAVAAWLYGMPEGPRLARKAQIAEEAMHRWATRFVWPSVPEMEALLEEHREWRLVADALGVTYSALCRQRRLLRENYPPDEVPAVLRRKNSPGAVRRSRRVLTREQTDLHLKARRLYEEDPSRSLQDVADLLQVARDTASRWIHAAGGTVKPRFKPLGNPVGAKRYFHLPLDERAAALQKDVEECKSLRGAGWTKAQLRRHFKAHARTIQAWIDQ